METYRLFAAVKLPGPIVDELSTFQKGVPNARWSDPEKFHVTLGFFGDVGEEQAEALDARLAEISMPPFDLRLHGTGHFGKAEPHAIWIGVTDSPELEALHKAVKGAARKARVEMEKRDYRPHLTLAYLGRYPDIAAIAKWEHLYSDYESAAFTADRFFLYSSWRRRNGANRYELEASYPLRG